MSTQVPAGRLPERSFRRVLSEEADVVTFAADDERDLDIGVGSDFATGLLDGGELVVEDGLVRPSETPSRGRNDGVGQTTLVSACHFLRWPSIMPLEWSITS